MTNFAWMSIITGIVLAGMGMVTLIRPDRVTVALHRFPRSVWPGRILVAVDLIWVAWVVSHASLGRFEWVRPYVWPLAGAGFFLVIHFMDELLSSRALGGLLLLLGNPVLNAGRWLDNPWRLVMVVLVYLWVIAGMVLLLSPFRFRKTVEWMVRQGGRLRTAAGISLLTGIVVIVLALTQYRP